ncbi:uncharacterized protein [Onthophagus taurus]|uniref:uncharacterized protein isoform X1 n=1 Tax=Onthophagus taurus TaxID=166361 RepID=UPI0039BDAC1C
MILRKIILFISFFIFISCEEQEDLQIAEANGKLEIIKQIKKVNDDGSYTIGYEADDGSFKIESRDVLGNVKGTYGYIDENGDIKRVSYTSNNSSELKTESSVVQRIPKLNKTTTRRPVYVPTIPPTTSSSQNIAKRRVTTTTTTTTESPKVNDFIKSAVEASKNIKYENQYPRILLQRPILSQKSSEGQIVRPDTNIPPTEPPIYPPTLLDKEKTISNEEGKIIDENLKNNLRRQLQPSNSFNPKDHVMEFQQNRGGDMIDVYTSSLTTGSPQRPLFTTTSRPKYISSTISPLQGIKYQYQPEITTTPTPQIQIPSTKEETLVAITQPDGRTILVPLREIPEIESDNFYIKRYQPIQRNPPEQQKFRAIPVRVDENGYIREMQPQYHRNYEKINDIDDYINNEEVINSIKPPVSTRDFQKLLEQLILRQSRLEQISFLSRKYRNMFGQKTRPVYKTNYNQNLDYGYNNYVTSESSYTPTRRVARLLTPQQQKDEESDYLPADVREMLLLRMLQLAINPGLPLNVPDNLVDATTSVPKLRKSGVRNVEILGEEDDSKISGR